MDPEDRMTLRTLAPLLALFALAGGCAGKPCQISNDCDANQVCASGHCAALAANELYFAIEPETGSCRPLPVAGQPAMVRGWQTCENPCVQRDEYGCIGDPRCQPVYQGAAFSTVEPCMNDPMKGGVPGDCLPKVPLTFLACRPNPLPIEPPVRCSELSEADCLNQPACQMSETFTKEEARFVCVERPCQVLDEAACLAAPQCHPIGGDCYCPPYASCSCAGGRFTNCDRDDQLVRCTGDADCGAGMRCNIDEGCLPPVSGTVGGFGGPCTRDAPCAGGAAVQGCVGACVPVGCAGFGAARCGADPACEPGFALQCAPYCGGDQGGFQGGAGGCGCEPTFAACAGEPGVPGVETSKSLAIRDPEVVDRPAFAFAEVMRRLAGGGDPAPLVNDWMGQITHDAEAGGRWAAARPGAVSFFGNLPRRGDGSFDPSALGLRVTSLVNRLDLASSRDCGEARITYARMNGESVDKRSRMTVIVELSQPDDGEGCRTVARRWLALGKLQGAELGAAVEAIYAPLLTKSGVNQIRTNEFLVADQPFDAAWELREWRFGDDGRLHLAPSKQAVEPMAAATQAFRDWAGTHRQAILAGTAIVPDEFLAVRSSEDGTRIQTGDAVLDGALNKSACAGCHLTETNSAFVHVGERMAAGRSQLSEFIKAELVKRGNVLTHVAQRSSSTAWRPVAKTGVH
jgi:hypothetical protein